MKANLVYGHGGRGNNILNGFRGDDYLEGNSGADRLDGGIGRDVLLGGAGIDEFYGGDGVGFRVHVASMRSDVKNSRKAWELLCF